MGSGKIPMRMCTGCREMKPKRELMRIVKTPNGEIKADATGKLNGRGAYICKSPECFKKLNKARLLDRVFKTPVPQEVYAKIEEELVENAE